MEASLYAGLRYSALQTGSRKNPAIGPWRETYSIPPADAARADGSIPAGTDDDTFWAARR